VPLHCAAFIAGPRPFLLLGRFIVSNKTGGGNPCAPSMFQVAFTGLTGTTCSHLADG
jgi:hypothetical protein